MEILSEFNEGVLEGLLIAEELYLRAGSSFEKSLGGTSTYGPISLVL